MALLVGLLWTGCSTQKDALINRTYHNTTARYNGYFNAKESVKGGMEKIAQSYEEDYTKILPIFIEGTEASARSVYPDMDRAIEKCTDVISRHSMYIKKEEKCKWIDNCYLLIGEANYHKRDYTAANEMFNYVAKEYEESEDRFDAMLWLVRSYTDQGNYSKANSFLNLVGSDGAFPKNKLDELRTIRADFYLKQKSYGAATSALQSAIEITKNKAKKTRLTFILAQVYQEMGNASEATRYYQQVVRMNPEYEMKFYATINQAMIFQNGSGNEGEIKEQLMKMLKDEKNVDYFDQLYYALAEIELKQGNEKKGIEYLKLSTKNSVSNNKQKTKSYLRLADIYFKNQDYVNAQANYDSTVQFIDKNREDYLEILDTRNSLTFIVKDIKIVEREDSLQRVAAMPEKQQEKLIDDIIDKIIEEEERLKQEKINQLQAQLTQNQNQQSATARGGGWYFYNPSTVSYGKTEFLRKWGERKLEDHWRRKDKSSGAQFGDDLELEQVEEADTNATANDLKSPAYYKKNIPNSKEKMKKSNDAIIDALYDLGVQYKEELGNIELAIGAFEDLVNRYDTSKNHLNAYYQLYRLHLNANNSTKANYYKNLILDKFPNSQYAKLIKNPNYLKEEKQKEQAVQDLYETAYEKYNRSYYSGVVEACNSGITSYPQSGIVHKFLYLKSLAYAAMADTASLKKDLTILVEQHGTTTEGELAKKALQELSKDAKQSKEEQEEGSSNYEFKPDKKHNFILIIPTSSISDAKVKQFISDFNSNYFRQQNLKISSTLFGNDYRMVVVKDFPNMFGAMDYLNAFEENTKELAVINASKLTSVVISLNNYPTFYRDKDLEGYGAFFLEKYK